MKTNNATFGDVVLDIFKYLGRFLLWVILLVFRGIRLLLQLIDDLFLSLMAK